MISKIPLGLCFGILWASAAYGQTLSAYDGVTPTGLAPGSTASSYPLLNYEHYNAFGGTLNPSMPLYHVGGRGNAGFDLVWNLQQVWRAKKEQAGTSAPIVVVDPYPGSYPSEFPTANNLEVAGIVYSRTGITMTPCSGGGTAPNASVTRVIFRTPTGAEVELVDKNTGGAVYNIANGCSGTSPTYDANRGKLFTSTDGSATNFISDSKVLEQINPAFGEGDAKLNGLLVFSNGVTYRIDNSTVTYIRDTNGNKTTFAYGSDLFAATWYLNVQAANQITDSNGRVVTINYHDTSCGSTYCTSINYYGFEGTPRKIAIRQENLSNGMLRDGGSVETFAQLFPTSQALGGSTTFDPVVVNTISFPDNLTQVFKYNVYGELTQMNVTAAGSVQYDYGDGHNASASGFEGNPTDGNPVIIYRRLQTRREYSSGIGAGLTAQTKYNVSYGSQTVDTDITYDPGGTPVDQVVHRMVGSPLDALSLNGTSCNTWNEGQEVETDYGIAPVNRTVTNGYLTQSGCMSNPQVLTVKTVNDANQASQVSYIYDGYNNVLQQTEYALGTSGMAGAALRTTVNKYQWQHDPRYYASTINLVRAPYSSYVYAGTNITATAIAGKEWHYDESGLTDEAGSVPGHDTSYLAAGVATRTNVTTASQFLATVSGQNQYVTQHMTYDSLGNVLTAQDANGNTTTLSYTDNYADGTGRSSYAYVTGTTNALGQGTVEQYDYMSGALTAASDPNHIVTTYAYWTANDGGNQNGYGADHPGITVRDANGLKSQTITLYPNPNTQIVKQDQTSSGDRGIVAYKGWDGFGRLLETDQFESTSSVIVTCTLADALGRPAFVTEPFRSSGSPTCRNASGTPTAGSNPGTAYVRDVLGRVTKATYADGSVETTSYNGTTVTDTDPVGHVKLTVSDVDNNLVQVSEDQSALNYKTVYQYDPLDNLTLMCQGGSGATISGGVCQNGQQRSFAYDPLSRQTGATNPESGSYSYGYDSVGNLKSRTETGRGITTSYSYDALNRPLSTTYGDGVTPNVRYTWDTAGTNGVGQLQSVAGTNGVTVTYGGYDGLGNVTQSSEAVGTNSYSFGYRYNLASVLTAETYPSGRQVGMGYDGAGRVANVTGTIGPVVTPYVAQIGYAPKGSPTQYGYANGVWRQVGYNTRLQPATAVDGTGWTGSSVGNPLFSSTWNWNLGTSGAKNNGNLQADSYTHSGGGLSGALSFAHSYAYDGVNRLTTATETGNWQRGFNYDAWGNGWVDTTRTNGIPPLGNTPVANVFNSNTNRITSGSYDNAGNQTSVNGNTLTYDAENRVSKAVDPSGTETILYDGSGQRVEKIVGSASTLYVYDAFGTLAAQYSSASVVTAACTTCYLSADQIGSTRLVTDQTGAVVARHDFLPFGEEITSTGGRTVQWGSATDVIHKFTGQLRDTESALDFFNARYYGYALNRFTSVDPGNAGADLGNPQSWNGYAYVWNNPVNGIDPTGTDACDTGTSICVGVPGPPDPFPPFPGLPPTGGSPAPPCIICLPGGGMASSPPPSAPPPQPLNSGGYVSAPVQAKNDTRNLNCVAFQAVNAAYPQTTSQTLEYGGFIVKKPDQTYYSSRAFAGSQISMGTNMYEQYNNLALTLQRSYPGYSVAAWFHDHPIGPPGYNPEKFSDGDRGFTHFIGGPGFLMTPTKRFLRVDPTKGYPVTNLTKAKPCG